MSDSKKSVEEELMRLRERLWKIRGRRSRVTGAAFLIVSGFFLFLAYVTRYIVFEVISILALLLGVVFVFTSVESYVRTSVANRAVVSALMPLAKFMNHLDVDRKAVYIPALSNADKGRMFIRLNSESPVRPLFGGLEDATAIDTSALGRGVFLPSIGSGLLQLYERELGDIRNFDLDYFVEWFPRVFVEGLKMAERMEMLREDDEVKVKVVESALRYLCEDKDVRRVCEVVGCPIVVSIGEAIAKNRGCAVFYLKCEYDLLRRETNVSYKLGPSLEDLKQRENSGGN